MEFFTFLLQGLTKSTRRGRDESVNFWNSADTSGAKEHRKGVRANIKVRTLSHSQQVKQRSEAVAPIGIQRVLYGWSVCYSHVTREAGAYFPSRAGK
jgi:hypothetical protein